MDDVEVAHGAEVAEMAEVATVAADAPPKKDIGMAGVVMNEAAVVEETHSAVDFFVGSILKKDFLIGA